MVERLAFLPSWQILPVTSKDVVLRYRLEQDGVEEVYERDIIARDKYWADVPSEGVNTLALEEDPPTLWKLVFRPLASDKIVPIPNTGQHTMELSVILMGVEMCRWRCTYHDYEWRKVSTVLKIGDDEEEVKDMNRRAETVVFYKDRYLQFVLDLTEEMAMGDQYATIPRVEITGERGVNDHKSNEAEQAAGRAVYTTTPTAYFPVEFRVYISAREAQVMTNIRSYASTIFERPPIVSQDLLLQHCRTNREKKARKKSRSKDKKKTKKRCA